jgi:hypothetical protein
MQAIFGSFFLRQIDEGDSLIPLKKNRKQGSKRTRAE